MSRVLVYVTFLLKSSPPAYRIKARGHHLKAVGGGGGVLVEKCAERLMPSLILLGASQNPWPTGLQ